MRLDYIWIEDYKGFKKEGFNFSNEFVYNFDFEKSYLTRTRNNKFIRNFYGDTILSVTGIIGKNASGKTNLLELVQYIIEGAHTIVNKPFFAVFESNGEYIVHKFKLPLIGNNFDAASLEYNGVIQHIDSIFFSNIFDGRRHYFGKKIIDISTNDLLNSQFGENINKSYQRTLQQQIRFVNSPYFKLVGDVQNNDNSFNVKPSRVVLTTPIWSNIISKAKLFDERFARQFGFNINLTSFTSNYRKKISDNKSIGALQYFTAFIVFFDFVINRDVLENSESKAFNGDNDYVSVIRSIFKTVNPDLHINEIFDFITSEFALIIDRYWNAFETYKFLIDLRDLDLEGQSLEGFRQDFGRYSNRRIQFTLDFNKAISTFLNSYLDAITNQSLSFGIEWSGLSSGHKAFLNLFSRFYSALSKIKEDSVLLSIDEGDLYFHPKWQSEFFFKLVSFLPKLLGKNCQIILTTHSPFLVSDMLKTSLLFVEKSLDGDLSVLPLDKIEGETFGGNIGDLYLDAFFMDGSLMSYFSASKIRALLSKIERNDQIKEEDRTLLDSIGEDLIKLQIKKLMNDKN